MYRRIVNENVKKMDKNMAPSPEDDGARKQGDQFLV